MRQIFLVTCILISLKCFGQDTVFIKNDSEKFKNKLDYKTDTLIFESAVHRHYLTGTTILPATNGQMHAHEYGLWFTKLTKTDCQHNGENEKGAPDRINSIISNDTSIIIDISIYDNCCHSFLCDISVEDESIINLAYIGYGSYCFCGCFFGLTYTLNKVKTDDLKKIKSVMLNGNRKTLKNLK